MRIYFLFILLFLVQSVKSQFNTRIIGEDTTCIGSESEYSVELSVSNNQFLSRESDRSIPGGNGNFAIDLGYNYTVLENTFSYDLWVKPTRAITMYGESSACAGAVSVPLAYSGQNWAIVPNGLSGGEMSVGLTIGTNGLMVGEHSGNILVSRLSYATAIDDWVHVAIVYRTDSIFLFLNGNLVRSRQTPCSNNTKRVTSGLTGYYYASDYKGDIDEFRLWDKALTREEVRSIMHKKFLNNVDGLRYYASFDNGKFERTFGDIGTLQMNVQGLDANNIKSGDLGLSSFTGNTINTLEPFSESSFNYLWSTGSTNKTTMFTPSDTLNKLKVSVYNQSVAPTDSMSDSLVITGIQCCSQTVYDTIKVYDTTYITHYDTISTHLCNNSPVPADALVGYWPFNGNANDESGNGHNGEVHGATLTTDRFGNENSAYSFDGVDNYIQVPDSFLISNNFTISFWAQPEKVSGLNNVLCDGSSFYGGNDFLIGFEGNSIRLRADKQAPLNYEYTSPTELQNLSILDKWVNVVWVMKPDYSKIFLNGNEISTINVKGSNSGYHNDFSVIGGRDVWDQVDSYYKGKLDEIAIYNRALSADEVMNLFHGSVNNETFHDTIRTNVYDTIKISVYDTIIIPKFDTTFITHYDTITTRVYDSVSIPVYDTLYQTVWDTIYKTKYDTIKTEVYDTVHIPVYDKYAVTDTLIIDITTTGNARSEPVNTIKVYPNPTKDYLYINTGENYQRVNQYTILIFNRKGSVVFESLINEPEFKINMDDFGSTGLYFLEIIDKYNKIVDVRKIILE